MSENKSKLMGFAPATEGEDPIITRERDSHLRHLELFEGVAAHLPGWKFKAAETDRSWYGPRFSYQLVNASAPGQAIDLEFGRGPYDRKVIISGHWPQRGPNPNSGSWTTPHDVREQSPSIRVALDRGYQVIAQQIVKRFLPEYSRIWNLIKLKLADDDAYQNKMEQNWARIAESGLVIDPRKSHGNEYRADARIGKPGSFDLSQGYGEVRMSGADSVQIELRSLPIETALRVLAALKGGK